MLTYLIENFIKEGKWSSMKIGRGRVKVSYLMFVDNLILFRAASKLQAKNMMECLRNFCNAFRQKNQHGGDKNFFFSKNVPIEVRKEILETTGFSSTNKNLGLSWYASYAWETW